jgi:hypothetical protein
MGSPFKSRVKINLRVSLVDGAVYVGDVWHGMRVQKFVSQKSKAGS